MQKWLKEMSGCNGKAGNNWKLGAVHTSKQESLVSTAVKLDFDGQTLIKLRSETPTKDAQRLSHEKRTGETRRVPEGGSS